MEETNFSCVKCGIVTCDSQNFPYPQGCVTEGLSKEALAWAEAEYHKEENQRIAQAAASIEGQFYGKKTRVEEVVLFAKRIGAKKVGIATCAGTIREARTFAKILEQNGIEAVGVACKVGNQDKTQIGIPEENKIRPGNHEPYCNPIMQAAFLDEQKTDLNVVMGLCVGHDTLFFKYCKGLSTVLFTKDRVAGHCAVLPLYQAESYYSRLTKKPVEE